MKLRKEVDRCAILYEPPDFVDRIIKGKYEGVMKEMMNKSKGVNRK